MSRVTEIRVTRILLPRAVRGKYSAYPPLRAEGSIVSMMAWNSPGVYLKA